MSARSYDTIEDEIDAIEQAEAMAAIRARFPRKVYATLAQCGGDESVIVERIADYGAVQWKANRKVDRDGISGWGSTVDEAIVDLSRSESICADMKKYGGGR